MMGVFDKMGSGAFSSITFGMTGKFFATIVLIGEGWRLWSHGGCDREVILLPVIEKREFGIRRSRLV